MNRIEAIETRITKHLEDVLGVGEVMDLGLWTPDDTDPLHTPFGYRQPEGPLVRFCPELIAATVAGLNDTDVAAYLDAVEIQMDFYMAHRELEGDELIEAFDRFLAEEALGSLQLMNAVHMAWLDNAAHGEVTECPRD